MKLQKRTNARAIVAKERYLPFLFLCIIILHLLIYSRQTCIEYGLGEWDYRYFLPIYVPLLYFAFSFLHQYNVLDKVKEVVTALASCIVILTPALIVGVCVFGKISGSNDFYTLGIMCKYLAWVAIAFLVVSFGFLALKQSDHSKELFAYAIGFIYSKAPCTGSAHPVMNRIHGLIAYHAGLRFFMKKIPPIIQLLTPLRIGLKK